MIDELKRQIAEIDKDLKPVLAHVEAAQARRAQLVKQVAAMDATAKVVPPVKPPEKPKEEAKAEPKPEAKPGKK